MVLSESEKEEVKSQARKLMGDFSDELKDIGEENLEEEGLEPREEGEAWKTEPSFRDLMFLNAPFVEEDYLVAERGDWKRKK